MMWTFFSVSVMLAVSWTVSAQGLDDPCTVMPHGPEITENGGVVTVPSECLKGRVWWNYPRGTLEVQFHQPKLFTVCLEPSLGPFLSSVSQVDGNGKEISINLRPDELSCTPVPGKDVTILMKQPEYLVYMTLYNFKLLIQS
ncbi:uncharacterized protein LOC112564545 [Pomacea canaliculata]|uniref:uncharacterized protein LOC112564545 n=1 Tax=Pomacea canaliculata TaxID=400727 RepID=UPI000D731A75|nr:uncharacterized protein LOC112564545 [Pomacea canaliculata]